MSAHAPAHRAREAGGFVVSGASIQQEFWNPARHAIRARGMPQLAGEHVVVGFSYAIDDPGFQVRICEVSQMQRRPS